MIVRGLVSVIIPVYNRPQLLREAVESVLAQTYKSSEIIIVDDGSTDDTPDAIRTLIESLRHDIRSVRQENAGPGSARECGRALARGEFIQYVDSDDLLLPDKFKLQVEALRANPQCVAAYGKTEFQVLGQPRSVVPYRRTGETMTTMMPSMLAGRWWCTNTALYRREACDAVGAWTNLRMEEDWEYDTRIAKFCNRIVGVQAFVSIQRAHNLGHACTGATTNPAHLRDRCTARMSILNAALEMGFSRSSPEFRAFVDESFLVARQADRAGVVEAGDLLRQLQPNSHTRKVVLYRTMRAVLGGRLAASCAEGTHALLSRRNGHP